MPSKRISSKDKGKLTDLPPATCGKDFRQDRHNRKPYSHSKLREYARKQRALRVCTSRGSQPFHISPGGSTHCGGAAGARRSGWTWRGGGRATPLSIRSAFDSVKRGRRRGRGRGVGQERGRRLAFAPLDLLSCARKDTILAAWLADKASLSALRFFAAANSAARRSHAPTPR